MAPRAASRHPPRPLCALIILLLQPVSLLARPNTNTPAPKATSAACTGRTIYTLPLPSKFNLDLMYDPEVKDKDVHANWWTYGMVKHLEMAVHNGGFGKSVPAMMGVKDLHGAWYQTDQNTLENIFYHRLLTYQCRSATWENADLIYVPYFGGHDSLRNMHKDVLTRDTLAIQLAALLKTHPAWQRFNGSDFFLVLGRNLWDFNRLPGGNWGSKLLSLDGVKENIWTIMVETFPGVPKTISAPKPTAFHPQTAKQLQLWQDFVGAQERRWLFSFAGGHRGLDTEEGVLREKLFWQCKNSKLCSLVDCSVADGKWERCQDMNQFFGFYMAADFCLHPMGDACSRRSVLDAALAGCIPVVFKSCTLEDQFKWHLGKARSKGSLFVHIPLEDVKGPQGLNATLFKHLQGGETLIEDVLRKIPREEIVAMRQRVIGAIPHLTYGGRMEKGKLVRPDFEDAVDVIVNGLAKSINKGGATL